MALILTPTYLMNLNKQLKEQKGRMYIGEPTPAPEWLKKTFPNSYTAKGEAYPKQKEIQEIITKKQMETVVLNGTPNESGVYNTGALGDIKGAIGGTSGAISTGIKDVRNLILVSGIVVGGIFILTKIPKFERKK